MGLGHPEAAAPSQRQPCSVLPAEEEGPTQPGPSLDRVMTTSEEPSPAQPGGTSELRWVLCVWVCRERKRPRWEQEGWHPVGRARLASVHRGRKGRDFFSREEKGVSAFRCQGNFEAPIHSF